MSQGELDALKEQVALLQARLKAQQELLEKEAQRRIALEDVLKRTLSTARTHVTKVWSHKPNTD